MECIEAVGFDLFNTLITVESFTLEEALSRMTHSLQKNDWDLEEQAFIEAHREAARGYLEEARQSGKETHNRFWISAALSSMGYSVSPDDPRIADAVERYFSAFIQYARLIPGTEGMLASLKKRYRLGLLSNFTHAPAALEVIGRVGISVFFDAVLISGEIGFRKPHPSVFRRLMVALEVDEDRIAYVGDDLEADVAGAQKAGILPIWSTYVRDRNLPFAPGLISENHGHTAPAVPRISDWEELLLLLDGSPQASAS